MAQPIIRGVQAVGAVDIIYHYNSPDGKLVLPSTIRLNKNDGTSQETQVIDTSTGVSVCGFRLDGEFLRAVQQIASSVQIPILGGGAVALTNNNRSGTLNINCTKVSTPNGSASDDNPLGAMYKPANSAAIGSDDPKAYDLVFLAQAQQAQKGGDSVGATLSVIFEFCGLRTVISFEGCTIVTVDPIALAGNDTPGYGVSINYLNWTVEYNKEAGDVTTQSSWTATTSPAPSGGGEAGA